MTDTERQIRRFCGAAPYPARERLTKLAVAVLVGIALWGLSGCKMVKVEADPGWTVPVVEK